MLLDSIKYTSTNRPYRERMKLHRGNMIVTKDYGVIKKCLSCKCDFFSMKDSNFCTMQCNNKFHQGANHRRWNGGLYIDGDGYVRVQTEKRSKYKLQHVLIIEKEKPLICHICKSTEDMLIHHRDENKLNNVSNNLTVLCRPCHQRVHSVMRGNKTTKHYEEILKFLGEK